MLAISLSRVLGFAGIALANVTAFTLEMALLYWLLSRKVPGIWQLGGTTVRVVGGAVAGGTLVLAGQLFLPFENWGTITAALVGAGLLFAGMEAAAPFVWPEVQAMIKL